MAKAKTNVNIGSAWTGTLFVDTTWYVGTFPPAYTSPDTKQSWFASLNSGAQIDCIRVAGDYLTTEEAAAVNAWVASYPGDSSVPFHRWGLWQCIVGAGYLAASDVDYELIVAGYIYDGDLGAYVWWGPEEIEMPFTITIEGIVAKATTTEATLADRSLMDFTDVTWEGEWAMTDDFAVTVTGSAPGGNLSAYSEVDASAITDYSIALAGGSRLDMRRSNTLRADGTVMAAVRDLTWDITSIPVEGLELYDPGTGTAPDFSCPNWKRATSSSTYWNVVDAGGGPGITHYGTVDTDGNSWGGTTSLPLIAEFVINDGQMDDIISYSGVTYLSNYIVWDDETTYHYEPFTSNMTVCQAQSSWQLEYEYRKFETPTVWVMTQKEWRETNGENVGVTDSYQFNDQWCAIGIHPINKGSFSGSPYWGINFLGVSQAASLDLLIPPGETVNPSAWDGENCTISNTTFTVADNAINPYVFMLTISRFPDRMALLNDHLDDEESEHNEDWIIATKANIGATLLDPEEWTSIETVYDVSNYSYIKIDIDAPKATTLILTCEYDVWLIDDPQYLCFEHRFGSSGEFSAQIIDSKEITWTFEVDSGNNVIQLDMRLNDQQEQMLGIYAAKHVTKWRLDFTDNDTDADEVYTLNQLKVVLDEVNTVTGHSEFRFKPSWSWGPDNSYIDFHGFGGFVDGINALEMQYGYPKGHGGQENGMYYLHDKYHCPDSELTSDIYYAKDLYSLYNELNCQEGFTATNDDPKESPENKDYQDVYMHANWYWWDIKNSHNYWDGDEFDGCPLVGYYTLLPGKLHTINFQKYPQGRIQGLVIKDDNTRVRESTNEVNIYKRAYSIPPWVLVSTVNTNDHGQFKSSPVLEKGYEYIVNDDETHILDVVNREYTTLLTTQSLPYYDPYIIDDDQGYMFMVVESEDKIYCKTKTYTDVDRWELLTKPFGNDTPYNRPSILIDAAAGLICAANDGTDTKLSYSTNYGTDWEYITTDLGNGLISGTVWFYQGTIYICGYDGTNIIMRSTSKTDYSKDDWGGSTELIVSAADAVNSAAPRSFGVMQSNGAVLIGFETSTGIVYYSMSSLSVGFEEVSTATIGDGLFLGTGSYLWGVNAIVGAQEATDSNDIIYRQSDKIELTDDDIFGDNEILIDNVLTSEDAEPKSCVNINNDIFVVLGRGGKLETYRCQNLKDGFVKI